GVNNSKGLIAAYTALINNNLINNFRYGFVRQGTGEAGLKNQHFVHFRGLDNIQGFDTSVNTHVPVHNFVDDISWTKGKHNLQFGANYRRIDNVRQSNSTSFFTAQTNVAWRVKWSSTGRTHGELRPSSHWLWGYAIRSCSHRMKLSVHKWLLR